MLGFSLIHRILRYSAFTSLLVILGILATTKNGHAQPNYGSHTWFQNTLRPIFSTALLPNPEGFRETNRSLESGMFEDGTKASKIQLKKSFLGSQKFIYDGKKPQGVYTFIGISFKNKFQEVMSRHPAALREAKKAYPYNALSLVSQVGVFGLVVKDFIDTVNASNEISSGNLVDDGFDLSDLVLLVVAEGISVTSGIIGRKHLRKGVKIFNERQEQSASRK